MNKQPKVTQFTKANGNKVMNHFIIEYEQAGKHTTVFQSYESIVASIDRVYNPLTDEIDVNVYFYPDIDYSNTTCRHVEV